MCIRDRSNPKIWEAIYNVPDEEIWKTRMTMKNKLVDYIRLSLIHIYQIDFCKFGENLTKDT